MARLVIAGLAAAVAACPAPPAPGQTTRPAEAPASQPASQPAAPGGSTPPAAADTDNPAAPGFDLEGSDPKAIEIADRVMRRLGGREAWDSARYITWQFFAGERRYLWDRQTGLLRIEGKGPRSGDPFTICMNVNTMEGMVWYANEPVVEEDRHGALVAGYKYWVNDGYWLLMPYKLKDGGVTLTSVGEDTLPDGRAADVIKLTFKEVGVTPANKYHVWVARDSDLVERWEYYADASDETPQLVTPWADWKPYGGILLSDDRGTLDGRVLKLENLGVYHDLPVNLLTSPLPINWSYVKEHYH